MRVSQKTGEPDYRQKNTVERERYEEARSASYGERRNRNGVYSTSLFERILERDNLNLAYLQVIRNKGAAGVDGMTYDQLLPYLKENRQELLQ